MHTITAFIQSFLATRNQEKGAVLAEYGLLLALIAVIMVAAIAALTTGIAGAFGRATAVL